ncbi:MAG: asparagine synthase (glutamine-hydrolyzing) [Desulfovibrionaceae bacterium]|nr:asparagine synthase (glutamine-hydrolyzing) [Desulfovibrionaceae bacterium]
MCGITGFWNMRADESAETLRGRITPMTNSMFARGPDSGGVWLSPQNGLALGHRRLAIRDLSPAGHQPMVTADGRYVLCYNGEVYNHEPLRGELEAAGVCFRGRSDSETLLYGCALLGVERTISRLTGMFAFAFWDNREKRLTLVRDRMGVKPLYWGQFGPLFLFGSELKSLSLHSGWEKRINRDAVAGLMDTGYIPAPLSIYEGIRKLRPGFRLEVTADGAIREIRWWDPLEVLLFCRRKRLRGDDRELIDSLDELLRDEVKSRMDTDVPPGAFLSGGVDSSAVTALMQAQSGKPVKTFSIGFEEADYNEAPFAKAVAEHLGTEHIEEYMTASQAREIIPHMASIYDEPFADPSQLPTFLLSRLARKHVAVALSGDGGDEFFCGYTRYFDGYRAWNGKRRACWSGDLPLWQQVIILGLAAAFSENTLDRLSGLLPSFVRPPNLGKRIKNFAARFTADPVGFYRATCLRHWPDAAAMVIGAKLPEHAYADASLAKSIPDIYGLMQFLDTMNYLPDDILVKVDRAGMAVSLETRMPLLDHRVYAFVWSLPEGLLTRDGQSKWPLREVLYRYVPKNLIERPKMGFGAPIDHWLRGPLRDWCSDLLNPARLKDEGFLRPEVIQPVWEKHLAGENYQYWLWNVLMFQSWFEARLHTPDIKGAALVEEVSA